MQRRYATKRHRRGVIRENTEEQRGRTRDNIKSGGTGYTHNGGPGGGRLATIRNADAEATHKQGTHTADDSRQIREQQQEQYAKWGHRGGDSRQNSAEAEAIRNNK